MTIKPHHIVIAGGGPSGLFLALLLLREAEDVRVTVIEAHETYPDIAKAYAFLPVLFEDFHRAGVYDDLAGASAAKSSTGINFRLSSDPEKRIIQQMPKVPGAPGTLLLSQKRWLEIVKEKVVAYGNADVQMGTRVLQVIPIDGDEVIVITSTPSGEERMVIADYLIGADGSRSLVRKQCEISFEGETLPQQLVATDVYYPFDKLGWEGANFMVDEKYYGMIGPINDEGLWRVSFGFEGDIIDEAEEQTDAGPEGDKQGSKESELDRCRAAIPEWFNNMFPGPKPIMDYEVDKVAAYRAQQRCASQFQKGRIILIGDAAHVTNPYIGMGLATGLLDAASLASVLSAIINESNTNEDLLLDSWAEARQNVFRKIIDPLSRKAFASVQDADIESFPDRHPLLAKALQAMRDGIKPSPPPVRTDASMLRGWPVTDT